MNAAVGARARALRLVEEAWAVLVAVEDGSCCGDVVVDGTEFIRSGGVVAAAAGCSVIGEHKIKI